MRPKYYLRLFGQMPFKKAFAFGFIFIVIVMLLYAGFNTQISPTIKALCDSRAKALALRATNEAIKQNMKDLDYVNLINVTTGDNGKITGLSANVIEMNELSTRITTSIQEKLIHADDAELKIPVGKLLGWAVFSGYGPKITIKAIPTGNVDVEFKTEFISEGINQIRHRIYLVVKTGVRMVAPFISDMVMFESDITVAETVIIGDTPTTYYNLEGLQDFKLGDTTNFMN